MRRSIWAILAVIVGQVAATLGCLYAGGLALLVRTPEGGVIGGLGRVIRMFVDLPRVTSQHYQEYQTCAAQWPEVLCMPNRIAFYSDLALWGFIIVWFLFLFFACLIAHLVFRRRPRRRPIP